MSEKQTNFSLFRKRIALIGVCVVLVCAASFYVQTGFGRAIKITATGEKNAAAEGSEIWIKNVTVDGKKVSPNSAFSKGWIWENNTLKWRSYDKPEFMQNVIAATFSATREVSIVFESNKWRGIVEVKNGFKKERIDCYSSVQNHNSTVEYKYNVPVLPIKKVGEKKLFAVLAAVFVVLLVIALCLMQKKAEEQNVSEHLSETPSSHVERELWIDVVKIISAFLIVEIHALSRYCNMGPWGIGHWEIWMFLNAMPRCAVPLFMMISGTLLLKKQYSVEKCLSKAKYALVAMLFWNVAYILSQALIYGGNNLYAPQLFIKILQLPVQRGPSGHLWYGYFLVWLYLLLPILQVLYAALSEKQKAYLIAVCLMLPAVLNVYARFFRFNSGIVSWDRMFVVVPYFGLLFSGRLIYDNFNLIPKSRRAYSVVTLVGLFGMFFMYYIDMKIYRRLGDTYIMEKDFFPVIYAFGIYALSMSFRATIQSYLERHCSMKNVVINLSNVSLGVYFSHAIFIWCTPHIRDFAFAHFPRPLWLMLYVLLLYLISAIFCLVMSKIPGVKRLVAM